MNTSAADIAQVMDLLCARVDSGWGVAPVTEVKRVWRDAA